MNRFVRHLLSRPLLFGILLAALVLRGLVPAGYMPAAGEAFAIEMCRVGLPAAPSMDETAQTADSHQADSSFCSFASAPGAGPAPHVLAAWVPPPAAQPGSVGVAVSPVPSHPSHDRQARAPPVLS